MNSHSQTVTQVIVRHEEPMVSSDPQPSTSKRKATTEDGTMQNNVKKKQKKEATTKASGSSKRKLIGEEQPGGLVIVRASSVRPHLSQEPEPAQRTNRSSSRQPSNPPLSRTASNGSLAIPPAKKYKAGVDGVERRPGKGKERERDALGPNRSEPEVDEDVRLMESEADSLRRQSRNAAESSNGVSTDFQFPAPTTNGRTNGAKSTRPPSSQSRGRTITRETSQPIVDDETPQIERNKLMRAEPGHTRRKSSLTRGKRITTSYASTGVITQPHTSVRESSFYKHIDVEQPEPQRARQLLIWCSYRAMNELSEEQTKLLSASRQGTAIPGKDPPPISSEDVHILKGVEEDIIKMLAESKIDTNVFSSANVSATPVKLKPNEQNVRNRAREVRFNAHIQTLKQEDEAWIEVGTSYNSFRSAVLAELEERKKDFPSAKAKGKRRATAEDVALWDISEKDLPQPLRGKDGLGLAKSLCEADAGRNAPLHARLEGLESTADRLHSIAHSALEATHTVEQDLDRRFAALNISLGSRAALAPAVSSVLSTFLPPTTTHSRQASSPHQVLRTMSRVDATRPQTEVGEAARRAQREVQRVGDAPERRLTGVPPPTPRKPPGTPRRAATPARAR